MNQQTQANVPVKVLQFLICAVSLISIQGCFTLHTTTVHDDPPSQTTTVYHEPAGDSVVTTTHEER